MEKEKPPSWTKPMCLQLIEEYRKRPTLWDPKDYYYFNTKEKEKAWDEVGRTLGKDMQECKRKMESIKGSFRRERSRINKAKKTEGKGTYISKWYALDVMKFLEDRADPKECYSKPPELYGEIQLTGEGGEILQYTLINDSDKDCDWENAKTEHESDVDLNDGDDTSVKCEPFQMVSVDEPILEPYEPYNNPLSCSEVCVDEIPITVIKPSSPSDISPIDIAEADQENQSPRIEERSTECTCRDECSTYGEHVANKLRKLDSKSRAVAQNKINVLLYKAEMKMFV